MLPNQAVWTNYPRIYKYGEGILLLVMEKYGTQTSFAENGEKGRPQTEEKHIYSELHHKVTLKDNNNEEI